MMFKLLSGSDGRALMSENAYRSAHNKAPIDTHSLLLCVGLRFNVKGHAQGEHSLNLGGVNMVRPALRSDGDPPQLDRAVKGLSGSWHGSTDSMERP